MATHRYWRINVDTIGLLPYGGYVQTPLIMTFVQMAAAPGGADQIGSGTPSASSSLTGSVALPWSSAAYPAYPQWWAYDFGSPVSVGEVRINSLTSAYGGNGPGMFDVQYSDNGTVWTTVKTFTAAAWTYFTGNTQVFELPVYATAPFTPGDLIRLAMLQAGSSCGGCGPGLTIGSTIYAEEMYVALNLLNGLVAQWQRRRWLVWDLTETVLVSTGAQSYSIGAGQAFNVARPDRIDSAFVRWLTTSLPLDAPLGIVAAREDYNQITLKTMGTVPRALFYDSAWPVGQLYFWPVPPAASYELHVFTKATVPLFGDLTTAIALPPEYQQALMFGLAVLLRPVMGLAADPSLNVQAAAAIATIRIANTQIPTLGMPPGLPGRSAGGSVSADVDINFQTGSW
jgi:hypothetical protein